MQHILATGLRSAGLSALLLSPISHARPQEDLTHRDLTNQLRIMKQELAAQRKALDALAREVAAQRALERELGAPFAGGVRSLGAEQLDAQRGTGNGAGQELPGGADPANGQATPAPSQPGPAATPAPSGPRLPYTGVDDWLTAGAGALLLGAGLTLRARLRDPD
jgi:hypothetical protein